jgi:hypothetical protein
MCYVWPGYWWIVSRIYSPNKSNSRASNTWLAWAGIRKVIMLELRQPLTLCVKHFTYTKYWQKIFYGVAGGTLRSRTFHSLRVRHSWNYAPLGSALGACIFFRTGLVGVTTLNKIWNHFWANFLLQFISNSSSRSSIFHPVPVQNLLCPWFKSGSYWFRSVLGGYLNVLITADSGYWVSY